MPDTFLGDAGSLIIPLNWIHPDQEVPDDGLGLVTLQTVTLRTLPAYLFRDDNGEWRFDHVVAGGGNITVNVSGSQLSAAWCIVNAAAWARMHP